MQNIVLFGGPGSGKGTQGAKIVDSRGLYHLSTGEVLRKHIADNTEIGKIANEYISRGHLIPDDLIIRIVEDIIDNNPEARSKGVIFDGFPRTIAQAEALDRSLAKRGMKVGKVIGLEVPDDILVDRLLKRGAETGRADDNADTIKNRIQVYHEQTQPLKQYYVDTDRYNKIDGSGSIDDIYSQIDKVLG